MGLFGPSKKEKAFVKTEAANLANYLKGNSVKFGGETYAKLQVKGILQKEVNRNILWMFWVSIFAFRVSKDMARWRDKYGNEIFEDVFWEMCEVDNNYFKKIPHEPFKEVFEYVSLASDVLAETNVELEQVGAYFLTILKEMPISLNKEQRFIIAKELWQAMDSFPPLEKIIKENV
jgi:hypothetical protein